MKGDVQAAGKPATGAPSRAQPLAAAPSTTATAKAERLMSWPRGILGWTATFAVLWALCVVAWNAGPVWLALAVFVLAVGFENAVQSLAGVGPRVASKHGKFGGLYVHFGRTRQGGTGWSRAGRLGSLMTMLVGFIVLGNGVIGLWEAWSPGYASGNREFSIVNEITSSLGAVIGPEDSPIYLDLSREQFVYNPWMLVFGTGLLAASGAWLLLAMRAPASRILTAPLLALTCCATPLALYHLGAWFFQPPSDGLVPWTIEGSARHDQPERVLAALPGALADARYASTLRVYLFPSSVVRAPDGGAPLIYGHADAESPMDRWHVGLAGPVRVQPWVTFHVVHVEDEPGAWKLVARLGRSADPGREAEWEAWLRTLVARVEG
jgi:hypothetical protein